jgi:hypothetical protein
MSKRVVDLLSSDEEPQSDDEPDRKKKKRAYDRHMSSSSNDEEDDEEEEDDDEEEEEEENIAEDDSLYQQLHVEEDGEPDEEFESEDPDDLYDDTSNYIDTEIVERLKAKRILKEYKPKKNTFANMLKNYRMALKLFCVDPELIDKAVEGLKSIEYRRFLNQILTETTVQQILDNSELWPDNDDVFQNYFRYWLRMAQSALAFYICKNNAQEMGYLTSALDECDFIDEDICKMMGGKNLYGPLKNRGKDIKCGIRDLQSAQVVVLEVEEDLKGRMSVDGVKYFQNKTPHDYDTKDEIRYLRTVFFSVEYLFVLWVCLTKQSGLGAEREKSILELFRQRFKETEVEINGEFTEMKQKAQDKRRSRFNVALGKVELTKKELSNNLERVTRMSIVEAVTLYKIEKDDD